MWESKNTFPLNFLSSSGWANNQINMSEINRRKCPKFIMDMDAGLRTHQRVEACESLWSEGERGGTSKGREAIPVAMKTNLVSKYLPAHPDQWDCQRRNQWALLGFFLSVTH